MLYNPIVFALDNTRLKDEELYSKVLFVSKTEHKLLTQDSGMKIPNTCNSGSSLGTLSIARIT